MDKFPAVLKFHSDASSHCKPFWRRQISECECVWEWSMYYIEWLLEISHYIMYVYVIVPDALIDWCTANMIDVNSSLS